MAVVSPSELGGLKSPEYLAIHPQGKMPALQRCFIPDGDDGRLPCLAESDCISRMLMDRYASLSPSFQPCNPQSNVIARFFDIYLAPLQGAMYKFGPPFAQFGMRADALKEYQKQLSILEQMIPEVDGLYLLGNEVSYADATLFPSLIFANFMLPKFGVETPLPPKLSKWFDQVREEDSDFKKIYQEVSQTGESAFANSIFCSAAPLITLTAAFPCLTKNRL